MRPTHSTQVRLMPKTIFRQLGYCVCSSKKFQISFISDFTRQDFVLFASSPRGHYKTQTQRWCVCYLITNKQTNFFLEFITIFFIRDQSLLKWRKNSKYKVPPIPESIIFFSSPKFLKSQRIIIVNIPLLYTCLCLCTYLFKESLLNVTLISTNNKQIGNLCYFFFLTGLSSQMSTTGLIFVPHLTHVTKYFSALKCRNFCYYQNFFIQMISIWTGNMTLHRLWSSCMFTIVYLYNNWRQ